MWIWVGPMNPTNTQLLTFYEIKDIYITNQATLNIMNSKKLSSVELKKEIYDVFNDTGKYYFYRKLGNFYVLDFSNNSDVADNSFHSGGESFKSGVHRLYFSPLATNSNLTFHI